MWVERVADGRSDMAISFRSEHGSEEDLTMRSLISWKPTVYEGRSV